MSTQACARRRALLSMAALCSIINGALWSRPALAATDQDQARSSLLRLVTLPQAQWVGDAVLPQMDQATCAALVSALTARLATFSGAALTTSCALEVLQQAFQKSVRADFAAGRCLSVGGWVLARTEVELCALAALSADRA